jgi:hypothetical protein
MDTSKLKNKHIKTLGKIANVENDIPWSDIESLLDKLGCTITNGEGSRMKVNIGESVWTVHLGEDKLKFGITRELKKILVKEKIL